MSCKGCTNRKKMLLDIRSFYHHPKLPAFSEKTSKFSQTLQKSCLCLDNLLFLLLRSDVAVHQPGRPHLHWMFRDPQGTRSPLLSDPVPHSGCPQHLWALGTNILLCSVSLIFFCLCGNNEVNKRLQHPQPHSSSQNEDSWDCVVKSRFGAEIYSLRDIWD